MHDGKKKKAINDRASRNCVLLVKSTPIFKSGYVRSGERTVLLPLLLGHGLAPSATSPMDSSRA
jgi:hypothetical protein